MRVLLLSRYVRRGASSRLREYQYIPYLESQGFEIDARPLLGDDYLDALHAHRRRPIASIARAYAKRAASLLLSGSYDLIWLDKELFPFLPAVAERALHASGVPYVVDFDDAVFHSYDQHRLAPVRWLMGRKIDYVMRSATAVVAGNSYLAERAVASGATAVAVVPTVVDLDRYPSPQDAPDDHEFTIGWIGSPTTARYVLDLEEAVLAAQAHGSARLRLIGSGPVEFPSLRPEIAAWSEDDEVAQIRSFDVGVMPLQDAAWERGKCGYKLIQYMACGLPVVASPIGVNRRIVRHGVNGFLAETKAEWAAAFSALRASPELRRRMGAAGRALVEAEYCTRVTAPFLASLLDAAGSEPWGRARRVARAIESHGIG